MINETREEIKQKLETGFEALSMAKPYVVISGFPDSEEALEEMRKEAKPHDEGAFFITYASMRPGAKTAGIYPEFVDVYTVYIFSNSKESDAEIVKYYETARKILYTMWKTYLYYGEMSPVKTGKAGLWMSALQVGKQIIYQGQ